MRDEDKTNEGVNGELPEMDNLIITEQIIITRGMDGDGDYVIITQVTGTDEIVLGGMADNFKHRLYDGHFHQLMHGADPGDEPE